MARVLLVVGLMLVAVALPTDPASAATVAPAFSADYAVRELGVPEGLPPYLGGMTLKAGDPNTLLVAANANQSDSAIYSVPLDRDGTGAIVGYAGPAELFANAPYIDGGLAYFPGTEVLAYTTYPTNQIGQILPGSTGPDRVTDLPTLGATGATGSLNFVPNYATGAGTLRVVTFNGGAYYTVPYSQRIDGTFDLGTVEGSIPLSAGLEGIESVPPGSPGFPTPSVLVSSFSTGEVVAYDVDGLGAPVAATARTVVSDLPAAMGGYLDPVSGVFLFSTWTAAPTIVVLEGFAQTNEADLAVTKTASSLTATVGDTITFTIEATNHGSGSSEATTVTDTLPAGLTYQSASAGCGFAGGTVTCALPALDADGTETFTVTVVASTAGTLANTATVPLTRIDPNGENNRSTATVTVSPVATTTTTTTAPETTTTTAPATSTTAPEPSTTTAETTTTTTAMPIATSTTVVGAATVTSTGPAASNTPAAQGSNALPRTGSDARLGIIGLALVGVGAATMTAARRVRIQRS